MTHHVPSARLPNGLKLPYVEQGEQAGVPVLLLHAYADSWRSFERLLGYLPPSSIHAFAVTQRGHGDAGRPARGYEVEQFASDLAAFMDAVALDAAMLVASSSASFTVQRFAVDHPQRTLGIVLSAAPWSLRDNPALSCVPRCGVNTARPGRSVSSCEFVMGTPRPARYRRRFWRR